MNSAPKFKATVSLVPGATFYGDRPGDVFGRSVSGAGDVNGDGFDDLIVGAPSDENNGTDAGSARVLSGVDGSVLFTFNGDSARDHFGFTVSGAGDVNSDGFDDVIVGALGDDANGTQSGSARVLSGVDGSVLFTFNGDSAGDTFGWSVSGAGDVNGDGFDDVIVGAFGDDNNGTSSGSARVLSGADGSVLFTFDGDSLGNQFGYSVSGAGDVNGDGFDDVIVGAVPNVNIRGGPGSARVLSGADGSVLFTFNGDSYDDRFGTSVSGVGDVNGDGFDDVIVGAYVDDNNGTDSGSAQVFSGADGSVQFNFNGDSAGDLFGFSVSGAGDVNGDGFDDVIVGAIDDDKNGSQSGSARIMSGADGSVLFAFNGDSAGEQLGGSVSGAGDVNGDGFNDVIVGTPWLGIVRLFVSSASVKSVDNNPTYTEGDAAVVIDPNVVVSDIELDALNDSDGDYNGASLTITRQGGANAEDAFSFADMANVTVNGANLEFGNSAIATFSSNGGTLTVNFTNANGAIPTTALVNEIIQAASYRNTNGTLDDGDVENLTFDWIFSDGIDALNDIFDVTHFGVDGDSSTLPPEPVLSPSDALLEYFSRVVAYEGGLFHAASFEEASGWEIDETAAGSDSGFFETDDGLFRAIALKKDGYAPVLVFRGTTLTVADWLENSSGAGVGVDENQRALAETGIEAWLAANPGAVLTGHSQGGAQAQWFTHKAAQQGIETGGLVTFNSPGVNLEAKQLSGLLNISQVTHYISAGDIVSQVGERFVPGNVVYYDFDVGSAIKLKLFAAAHTGHWYHAKLYDEVPIFEFRDIRTSNGGPDYNALSSPDFTHLVQYPGIDTDFYMASLQVVSFLTGFTPGSILLLGISPSQVWQFSPRATKPSTNARTIYPDC